MAGARILLSVPKELAIDMNEPNSVSIPIDPNTDTTLLRRSQRVSRGSQRLSPESSRSQSNGNSNQPATSIGQDLDPGSISKHRAQTAIGSQHMQLSTGIDAGSSHKKRKVLDSPTPKAGMKVLASDPALALARGQTAPPVPLHGHATAALKGSKSKAEAPLLKDISYPLANSSSQGLKSLVPNLSDSSVQSNTGKLPHTTRNRSNKATSHGSPRLQTARLTTATRRSIASKTRTRPVLEAHLRTHDNYGNVRHNYSETFVPPNHASETARVEAMFSNEPMMRRLEQYRAEQIRKNESEKKLWDLGEKEPWVRQAFTYYEEYEAWQRGRLEKKRQQDSMKRAKTGDAMEDTGDTTEEDDDGAILDLLDAADRAEDLRHRGTHHIRRKRHLMYGCEYTAKLSAFADICLGMRAA